MAGKASPFGRPMSSGRKEISEIIITFRSVAIPPRKNVGDPNSPPGIDIPARILAGCIRGSATESRESSIDRNSHFRAKLTKDGLATKVMSCRFDPAAGSHCSNRAKRAGHCS